MLLNEIKDTKIGTYAGVRFDDATIDALNKYIEDNKIPNPVKEFHTTLLFSRKPLPKYQPMEEYSPPLKGKPTEVKNLGDDKTIVVMFDAPELEKRHKELMKEHGATWDYESYIPHVSLSYDGASANLKDLTKPDFPINIVKEYSEALTLDED